MALNPFDDAVEQLEEEAPNPYDAIVRGGSQAQDSRLRVSVLEAGKQTPDAAAEARRLADQYGFPTSVIERNLDAFRERARVDGVAALQRRAPRVAEFLRDPLNAAVAHDDVEQLQRIDDAVTFGESVLRSVDNVQGMLYGTAEASGELLGVRGLKYFGRQGRISNEREAAAYGPTASVFALRGPWDLGQWVKESVGELIPIVAPIVAGAGAGAAVGSVVPVVGTALGAVIGAFIPTFAMGVGEVQGTIKQIDPEAEVPAAAFLGGAAIAALDSVVPGKIGGRLVATFGRETAEQIAKRALLTPVHPRYLRNVAGGVATEALTEAIQEGIGAVAGALGTDTALPDDLWRQMVEAGAKGGVGGGMFTGVEVAVEAPVVRARIAAAQQNKLVFDALAEGVKASKLAQRLPARAQAFVDAVTKNGPLATVFAPIETWTTYWQSQGVDPALVASELTGDVDAYARAKEGGHDLAIPTGAYAAKLAATDHHQYFAQELRFGPDLPNAREAAELQKQLDEQAAAPAKAEDPGAAVRADVAAQLEALGYERSVAETTAAAMTGFGVVAERVGEESAGDLYARYGVRVQREGLEEAPGAAPSVEPGELPDIPPSAAPAGETGVQRRGRRTAHVAALTSAVLRDALRVDPKVDPAVIKAEVEQRVAQLEERQAADRESGRGQDLLRAIAGYGGLWWEKRTGGSKGEIERMLEGRDIAGMKAGTARVVHKKGRATWNAIAGVFNEEGLPPDQMVRSLMQDARFAYLEDDLNKLLDAVDEALTAAPDVDALPGTEELADLGIKPGTAWWARGSRVAIDAQAIDVDDSLASGEEGDASFEFNQATPAQLELDALYPVAGTVVDGRTVREQIPNQASIGASLNEFTVLRGVREVQLSAFDPAYRPERTDRVQRLAEEIRASGELSPLIVVVDEQGPYILEGGHRFDALHVLGAQSFPALVVIDDQAFDDGGGVTEFNQGALQRLLFEPGEIVSVSYPRPRVVEDANVRQERPTSTDTAALADELATRLAQVPTSKRRTAVASDTTFNQSQVLDVVDESGRSLTGAGGGFEVGPRMTEVYDAAGRVIGTKVRGGTYGAAGRAAFEKHEAVLEARQLAALALAAPRPGKTGDVTPVAMLAQGDMRRGNIRFRRDASGRIVSSLISLGPKADLSTFLHETGHLYLEVLGDVADRLRGREQLSPTQQRLLADYEAILRFVGVEDRAAITVEQHEQFARAFEAYLFEGKAPSIELRSAFARFRAWLVGIYRSLRGLNVTLNDEVRGVFDRLLATDEAIAAAQNEARIAPLFTDAQSAGMTELEFASYQDQVREASERAREDLQARVLSELKREELAWWKAERDVVRGEVEREIFARPIYVALSALRAGTFPDGRPLPMYEDSEPLPMKLSRDSLVAQFGRDILGRLPRPYVYAADSGISADAAAENLRNLPGMMTEGIFSSGDALVRALVDARPMGQVIDAEVDGRMFEKHGDVLRDGRLRDEARRRVEGEHRAAIVHAELAALTKGMVRAVIPPAEVINAAARQRIAATRIRDLRPGLFLQAARRASSEAFALLATNQDRAGAVRAKLQELTNLALYREARDAKERVESMRRTLQAYGSTAARQRFGKAGADYLAQIDGFLDRYDLARVAQQDLDRRQSLRAFVAQMEAEEMPVDIPASLLDDSRRVNYQDVSVDELVGVYEAVEHIARLARLKNELLKAAKKRDFDEAKATLVGSIRLHNEARPQPLEFRPKDEKVRTVGEVYAAHSKIAMLARALDGHEDGGEFWEAVIRPINEAAAAEETQQAEAGEKLRALVTAAYPGRELARLNDQVYIEALGTSLSKEGALAVALNWGNEGNRARLLADRTRRWSSAQIQAVLETLDERDWRFVQGVWDFIDTFWPAIEEKQRRVTGLAPDKVDAAPFRVRVGGRGDATVDLRGGYYPIAYDGRLVARAGAFQKGGEATLQALAGYVRATTRRGHTEARAENVKMSVRLDLGVAFQHVEQVIHDLTHHEMLIDVSRLLGDPEVQQAILETKGDHVYSQFTGALRDIALGPAPASGLIDKAARFARTRAQIAALGWSAWTALQQPAGIFNGAQRVGVRWVARGLKRWLRDAATMQNTVAWIHEVSPAMRARHTNATQDLKDLRRELAIPGGWWDVAVRTVTRDKLTQQDILDSYLWHIGLAQKVADVPTWLGAYEKAMANDPDERRAILLADQAVIDSQGGGSIKDLAAVQRGSEASKLFLMFYSYGSTVFNATADAYGRTNFRSARSVGGFLGDLSLLYLMPALWTVTLSRVLGRTGDDDEPFPIEVGMEMLATAMNAIVIVRELSGILKDGVRGYAGPAGARAIAAVYRFAHQVKQGEADEALLKSAAELSGLLFRYPALQVQRTVDGFVGLQEGRTRNPFALVVGAPRE